MTPSLERQLDRFRDLIAQVGIDAIFAAPLVTPGDEWFPDRWSSDFESVRHFLLRLAEYAGLPDLDVEVLGRQWEPPESQMPAPVMEQRAASGLTGSFCGIHEGRAWFEVDWSQLRQRERFVGILAHEMAHAWRQVRGIHVTPHLVEEECTDLTAIALGFGILVANAAYQYRSVRTAGSGLWALNQWSHSVSGYLEVDDMAGLLACWARLKELPPEAILKHLGATQADAFRKVWARWEEDAIRERLGVAVDLQPTPPHMAGATEREFRSSLAAGRVHECVKRLVELAGEDGGLVPEPIRFPALVVALPNRFLAKWGRISAGEGWTRSLALVTDPEWDTEAILVGSWAGDQLAQFAVGHVRDADARDARRLGALIAPAFAAGSPHRSLLAPSLPTYVTVAEDAERFGMRELETMFREVANHASPEQVAGETAWLQTYAAHTTLRLDAERARGGIPPPPATAHADFKRWWSVITDPAIAGEEVRFVPWYLPFHAREGTRPARADEEPDASTT